MKKKNHNPFTNLGRVFAFISVALLIVFAGVGLRSTKVLADEVIKAAPEKYTELYFTDHQTLPRNVEGATPYSFIFTTHNLEGKSMEYKYEVYFADSETRQMIASGEFSLNPGDEAENKVDLNIDNGFQKGKVTVVLLNKRQEISFWVEEIK